MMAGVAELRGRIDERLSRILNEIADDELSPHFPGRPGTLVFDEVRAFTLAGGKRMRGVLLAGAAALYDEDAPREAVLDAAVAVELLQTSWLILDDIVDGDPMRRGRPSAHVALAAASGSPKLGRNLAIHAAVMASALSQRVFSRLSVEPERAVQVMRVYADMQAYSVQGGVLELIGHPDPFETAERKTAGYSVVGPMVMGALLGGAPEHVLPELANAARALGVAFQLHDDLLGTFGDPEATGKPIGSDLRDGRRTWLYEQGLALAGSSRHRLEAVHGVEDADPAALAAAVELLDACGARKACEQRVKALTGRFARGLASASGSTDAREFLVRLAWGLTTRRA